MTLPALRQQIAQMLIMGFDGTKIDDQSPVHHWLTTDGLGGVILFDYDLQKHIPQKNMVSQSQVRTLTGQLREVAAKATHAIPEDMPLFIAIDYEGGAVDRFRQIDTEIKALSPRQYAALSEPERQREAQKMVEMVKLLGFNLNFAPVVDLNLTEMDGIIGKLGRSYSRNPDVVAKIARQFVDVFSENGVICCYKHFPGHGSARGDTHCGMTDVTETFHDEELIPYRLLLGNPAREVMVMTAHVVNRKLDASGLPATLSKDILTGLLRGQMGFDGVIVSDDLQMNAVSKQYSLADSLRLTINAGADMLIFANQLGKISPREVIDVVEALVQEKAIDGHRIQESYQRIKRLKQTIAQ
ncbi:glycoside hydrolase family 3 protein [Legionella spiritensis]|uniref:beta-N-acetylhexosaminidase n=1 Tax=Legionella spiritensis TaxID=452 RepID=A0A0W0ZAP0_LEGSP|nr:glycoside hydrolase family 3 N-terminal domain-containing protein [Legionella spiritensis]KTD66205.1 glycosyl hydrolase [Legionella spiritensis]SNV35232.1 beta-N-acetylhexosaminidase [Legionella spiritensis]